MSNPVKKKVILVDDDKVVCNMLKRFIEHMGYDVVTINDSSSVFTRLKSDKFDLLMTDLNMPGSDGFELFNTCKENYPDMKVIMFTGFGHDYESKIKEALANGVACCIYKPFKFSVLEKAIKSTIG
jgi:DNA-binding NtrC family response regulator